MARVTKKPEHQKRTSPAILVKMQNELMRNIEDHDYHYTNLNMRISKLDRRIDFHNDNVIAIIAKLDRLETIVKVHIERCAQMERDKSQPKEVS